MTTTITPTVGRRIHFRPNAEHAALLGVFDDSQPCDAGVLYVHDDGTVNLDVTGPSGAKLAVQRVRIIPAGHVVAVDESHARWMEYQTAKAAQEAAAAVSGTTETSGA